VCSLESVAWRQGMVFGRLLAYAGVQELRAPGEESQLGFAAFLALPRPQAALPLVLSEISVAQEARAVPLSELPLRQICADHRLSGADQSPSREVAELE
jgi:hypothetical protein